MTDLSPKQQRQFEAFRDRKRHYNSQEQRDLREWRTWQNERDMWAFRGIYIAAAAVFIAGIWPSLVWHGAGGWIGMGVWWAFLLTILVSWQIRHPDPAKKLDAEFARRWRLYERETKNRTPARDREESARLQQEIYGDGKNLSDLIDDLG